MHYGAIGVTGRKPFHFAIRIFDRYTCFIRCSTCEAVFTVTSFDWGETVYTAIYKWLGTACLTRTAVTRIEFIWSAWLFVAISGYITSCRGHADDNYC